MTLLHFLRFRKATNSEAADLASSRLAAARRSKSIAVTFSILYYVHSNCEEQKPDNQSPLQPSYQLPSRRLLLQEIKRNRVCAFSRSARIPRPPRPTWRPRRVALLPRRRRARPRPLDRRSFVTPSPPHSFAQTE